MLYFLLCVFSIYVIYELVLAALEYNFIKKAMARSAVVLSEQDYQKAGIARLSKLKVDMASKIYALILLFVWSCFGLALLGNYLGDISENTRLNGVIMVLGFLIINNILSLPFSIYEDFVLDKKLGFSNMTPKLFIIDELKGLALLLIFGGLGVWVFSLCYDYLGALWWLWAYVLAFSVILLVNLIYPTLIAPIFNKMSPLENEALNTAISSLLTKCGFKSSGVFVMDASKRDNRLNAYFGGLGATKRVVLFDTLIAKLSQNEIIAVLAHELGHFKHKDLLKNIAMMAILLFILMWGLIWSFN